VYLVQDATIRKPSVDISLPHPDNMSSAPTTVSLAADQSLDRALGHAGVTSGGRGVRKYQTQMTKRDRVRLEAEAKTAQESEKKRAENAQAAYREKVRQMNNNELDYM